VANVEETLKAAEQPSSQGSNGRKLGPHGSLREEWTNGDSRRERRVLRRLSVRHVWVP
jgi:hypothetical protein